MYIMNAERDVMDASVEKLNEFLSYMAEKGLMKPSTVGSRKVAINKLFSVLSEEEKRDVFKLDVEEVAERFHNKHGMTVRPDTLKVYVSRVRSSIVDFKQYLENPQSFKPSISARGVTTKSPARKTAVQESANEGNHKEEVRSDPGTFSIPVPIRGMLVRIEGIPMDLTPEEARRIAAVIEAYAHSSES